MANYSDVNVPNRVYFHIYIDDIQVANYYSESIEAMYYVYVQDAGIGELSEGDHTIKLVVDPENHVAETNEKDNTYSKVITVGAVGKQPNLIPYKPKGWSDKIVVSKTTGKTKDDKTLSSRDNLFVDFAVANSGKGDVDTKYWITLSIDGEVRASFYSYSLTAGYYVPALDHAVGKLSKGTHTIEIVVDSSDDIVEQNEGDNEYAKKVTVK